MSLFCFFAHFGNIVWQLFYAKKACLRDWAVFWRVVLKSYVLFKYISCSFFKYVRPNLIYFFIIFCFCFALWYQKRAGLLDDFFFFTTVFFSVAVFGFFWLLYLFNFIQSFWNSTIIIYKVMYNRDHECHQMVKCIIIIFLFVSLVIQTSYYPTNYLHLDKNHY